MMRAFFLAAFFANGRRHYGQGVMSAPLLGTRCAGFLFWNCHLLILYLFRRLFYSFFGDLQGEITINK